MPAREEDQDAQHDQQRQQGHPQLAPEAVRDLDLDVRALLADELVQALGVDDGALEAAEHLGRELRLRRRRVLLRHILADDADDAAAGLLLDDGAEDAPLTEADLELGLGKVAALALGAVAIVDAHEKEGACQQHDPECQHP